MALDGAHPGVRLSTPSGTREIDSLDWETIRTVVFVDPVISGEEIRWAWLSEHGEDALLSLLRQRLGLAFA